MTRQMRAGLCLAWAATLALTLTATQWIFDQAIGSYFWHYALLLVALAVCEGAIAALSFYLWSGDYRRSTTSGILWAGSYFAGIPLFWLNLHIATWLSKALYHLNQPWWSLFASFSSFWAEQSLGFSGYIFLYGAAVSLLQVPLVKRFSRRGIPWIGVRMLALVVASATARLLPDWSPNDSDALAAYAGFGLVVGVSGLVKGLGFVWLLRRRRTPASVLE
ncbi:MAG: hypothetical protein AAFQ61_02885 [Cyanobacteria bacterium J06626_23]